MRTTRLGLFVVAALALSVVSAEARGGVSMTNPGTSDINRTIDSQAFVSEVASPAAVATLEPVSPLQPNSGAKGLASPATAEAIPSAVGGTAVLGATGRDMDECMAAWDSKTHVSKARWREICDATLSDLQS